MAMYFLKTGESLNRACVDNGINYSKCFRYMLEGMTPDEAFNYVISGQYLERGSKIKHMYKGMPLIEYCRQHRLPYTQIHKRWKNSNNRNKYTNLNKSLEEIVKMYENAVAAPKITYGMSKYCRERGYNYKNLYMRWYKSSMDKTFKEFVEDWERENGYSGETS